jgi:hypothetical protein
MNNLDLYCVTNKRVKFIENTKINLAWVGLEEKPRDYLECDNKVNIFYKEKYYSELTFQYWYWKNMLDIKKNNWIGFCQKRRFWTMSNVSNESINHNNIGKNLLLEIPMEYNGFNAIICKPISVSGVKTMKLIKRGWKNLIKSPSILFDKKKKNLALHFDMHHGYGYLDIAIEQMQQKDKEEFRDFVDSQNTFNPHIMFIAKPDIVNEWFKTLFPWLERCEKIIGFKNLKGYDTTRLYAYLAERYLSFWFKKYTNYKEHSWIELKHF